MSTKSPDSAESGARQLAPNKVSQSAERIDFEKAEIIAGFVNDTYFLVVSGTKPYLNMEVRLIPLIYVRKPEYWGIEVIGILPNIGLPATAPYHVHIPLEGITGTNGVEVIGATSSEKFDVPPKDARS